MAKIRDSFKDENHDLRPSSSLSKSTGPDGYICRDCLTNDALQAIFCADGSFGSCVYCEQHASAGALSIHALLEYIYGSLLTEFEDPADADIFIPPEVEDMFSDFPHSTEDLLYELGEGLGEDLQNQLADSIDHEWRTRDGLADPIETQMVDAWRGYAESAESGRVSPLSHPHGFYDRSVDDVFRYFDTATARLQTQLVRRAEPGTIFFRARNQPGLTTAQDLGSPAPDQTGHQRMSAKGDACFYASDDPSTATAETRSPQSSVTIGRWTTTHPLIFLDLKDVPDLPSLFDPTSRKDRAFAEFIRAFRGEIARPNAESMNDEDFYLPTQLFAGYLRHRLANQHQQGVDAIRYPSDARTGGTNWCLFGQPDRGPSSTLEFNGVPSGGSGKPSP